MIYLHIGWRKCGSSTLQLFLAENDELLTQNGFDYLKAGRRLHGASSCAPSHEHLARTISGTSDATTDVEFIELRKAAYRDKHSILSSELFLNFDPPQIENLRSTIGRENVRVFIYLRPFVEIMESEYGQYTKSGKNTDDIDLFVDNQLRYAQFPVSRLEVAAVIRSWAQIFSGDQVRVRSLSETCLTGGSLISDFAAAIGLRLPDGDSFRRVNEAPNWATVEFLRFVHGHLWPRSRGLPVEVERQARLAARRLLDRCLAVERTLGTSAIRRNRLSARHYEALLQMETKDVQMIREAVDDVQVIEPPPPPPERDFVPTLDSIPAEWLKEYIKTLRDFG